MVEDEIMEDISDWAREEASDWAREAAKKIIEPSEKIKEKIKNLINWIEEIKAELEKFNQPETTLVDILNTYLDMRKEGRSDWNKSAQTKGAVADLKKISQAIMILQNRNICTLDELNEILKPIDETRKSIKSDEKKIKRLKQHISKIEDYEKYKAVYDKYYANEKFVRVLEKDVCPQTKWVKGSNYVDVNFKIDPRTKRIIMMGAIDNLVKGAAGQAVQNMNLMFGLDETEGLNLVPMFP